jgi:hypothetical protein
MSQEKEDTEPFNVHSVQNLVGQSGNIPSIASASRTEQDREEILRILDEALELLEHSAATIHSSRLNQEGSSSEDSSDPNKQ